MATLAERPRAITPVDVSDTALYTEDTWREPFARLRAEAPVHYQANSPFGPFWSVCGHADIMAVEARPDIFSSSHEFGGITVVDLFGEYNLPQFIAMDRPDHTGQRRTVAPAFTPARMVAMEQDIRLRTADVRSQMRRLQQHLAMRRRQPHQHLAKADEFPAHRASQPPSTGRIAPCT